MLEQFVSRGMIADFAVHMPDKKGGIANPHFHVLCPIRPLEKDGTWGTKQHRVYTLDERGNRIRDETGSYVFNAVPTTDWGSPETLEHWREAWAQLCNTKFEEKGLPCRIDNRSYARQGLDIPPTVHEGPAVRQMEAKDIHTNKGNLNRWIRATNDLLRRVQKNTEELLDWLEEAKTAPDKSSNLAEILDSYYSARNANAYTQRAKSTNLKHYAGEFAYLQSRGIITAQQLQDYVSAMSSRVHSLRESTRAKASKMKELKNLIQLAEDFTRLKPIVDAIPPIGGWHQRHIKYMAEHDNEIRQFHAVRRKLDSFHLPGKKLTPKAWQTELDKLSQAYAAEVEELKPIYAELKKLRDIQYKINTIQHGQQVKPHHSKKEELFDNP